VSAARGIADCADSISLSVSDSPADRQGDPIRRSMSFERAALSDLP
jgi:hypothetical protein